MHKTNLRPLATTCVASGIWDSLAGVMYLFVIGAGRPIDDPSTHTFYSVLLASFFFCFAYLQFVTAFNIRSYLVIIGCLMVGRLAYVIQLYAYMLFSKGFPTVFWFTGIIDTVFIILYMVFTYYGGLSIKDLFPSLHVDKGKYWQEEDTGK